MADLPRVIDLANVPVHLGLGARAVVEPRFTGLEWYEQYAKRHAADGDEGRLVSMFRFDQSWPMWEMHPRGHEVVLVTDGRARLLQQLDGRAVSTELGAGRAAINEPGVWHTMDVIEPVTAVFITAGAGTEHRPRSAEAPDVLPE